MAKTPPRPAKRGSRRPDFNKPLKPYEQSDPVLPDPIPNFNLLSEGEKEELRKEAAAKVEAREKDRAEEAFRLAEEERIERELHPEAYEEEKEITLDFAIYADRAIINGKHYMHGRTYTVKKGVYDTLADMMHQSHRHQREISRDPNRTMLEAQQQIAKGGSSYATVSAATGIVSKF